jgi:poly(3-hydroxybutyrate) depolymerase
MKIPQLLILILSLICLSASCQKEVIRSRDSGANKGLYASPQFSKSELTRYENVLYSTRPNYMGKQFTDNNLKSSELQQNSLKIHLDIVVPPNATAKSRQPLIVFIHGGGFRQGSKKGLTSQTVSYASAGYVAATLNYRLTVHQNTNAELRTKAALHALEDVQNAIRFLKANAEFYHIDTTRIAVSGGSAGGGLALGIAIGADEMKDLNSDYPGVSARVAAAFPSGATLTTDGQIDISSLQFDKTDAPVMLFHNSEKDPATGATWQDVKNTEKLIKDSGNEILLVPQPPNTHAVSLKLNGAYWETMKPFLWRHLRLDEISEN